ncbi:hypothetical protein C8R47DRAFT_1090940 [Mycena vitilis]|nr:hypothetical protein C8R47DRAFT_1090940 [Mycena vitilis]
MLFDLLTFPRLERLAVSHTQVLTRMVAPALHSLFLTGFVEPVLPFLTRSGCTQALADLTLAECASPPADVIALLQQTTGLVSLRLDPWTPRRDVVAALTPHTQLCPALASFSFADPDDALENGALADLVMARSGVRQLNFVALYAGQRRGTTDERRLRAMPALELLILNGKNARGAVDQWREWGG